MMRKSSVVRAVSFLLAVSFLAGCLFQTLPGAVSGSNFPIRPSTEFTALGPTKGRQCGVAVFGIGGSLPTTFQEMIDDAARAKGGNGLTNVTTYATIFTWALVIPVTVTCAIVEGTAVKITKP